MTNPSRLSDAQLEQFIQDGFVRIDDAFPHEFAEEGLAILWRDTGCDANDPRTWTRPVIRLGGYAQEPFAKAVNTPVLHTAFDQLIGKGVGLPVSVWAPSRCDSQAPMIPGDAGWHVDASYPGEDPSHFFSYRINVHSRERALLMLFLFSDVSEHDAPPASGRARISTSRGFWNPRAKRACRSWSWRGSWM